MTSSTEMSLAALASVKQLDDRLLGGEQGAGEVVRLDPLADVLLEVVRLAVTEGEVPERLGDHRAGRAHPAGRVALRDVDHPVREVGDRATSTAAGRWRGRCEAEVRGELGEQPFGHGPLAGVADGGEGGRRRLLDLFEVVVAGAHLLAQFARWPLAPEAPPMHRRSDTGCVESRLHPLEQRDDVLDRGVVEARRGPQVGEVDRGVERVLLDAGEGDLELCAAVRRRRVERVGRRAAERALASSLTVESRGSRWPFSSWER